MRPQSFSEMLHMIPVKPADSPSSKQERIWRQIEFIIPFSLLSGFIFQNSFVTVHHRGLVFPDTLLHLTFFHINVQLKRCEQKIRGEHDEAGRQFLVATSNQFSTLSLMPLTFEVGSKATTGNLN